MKACSCLPPSRTLPPLHGGYRPQVRPPCPVHPPQAPPLPPRARMEPYPDPGPVLHPKDHAELVEAVYYCICGPNHTDDACPEHGEDQT